MVLKQEIVRTEAMRIARGLVKDELRRLKVKVSHVEASDITKCAKELLRTDPSIYAQAKRRAKRLINP